MTKNLRFQLWWLCLVVLALVGKPAMAQVAAPAWQTVVASTGAVDVRASIQSTDGASIYLVGGFSGTATFGSTSFTAAGTQDAFVAKWSTASSSFVWAVQAVSTGAGQSVATAIAPSIAGSGMSVVGNFTTTSFKLGGSAALTNTQAGTSDVWLARLTDNGSSASFAGAVRAGGTADDYASSTAIAGSVQYVGGVNGANARFGTYTVAAAGGYVAGYYTSPTGTAIGAPLPAGSNVTALTYATNANAVYAAGTFSSAANTFGDASHTLTSAGGDDAFVARFNGYTTLSYNWAQRAGGTGPDYARTLLATSTAVYVGGSSASPSATFGSTTLTNAGTGALYVARLTDAGAFTWAVQNGGGTNASNAATALLQYGTSLYVAGTLGGTATFGSSTLTSAGSADVVLAKLVDSGSSAAFVWGQAAGGAGADYGAGLARVGTQLYVTGHATTPASFGTLGVGTGQGTRPAFVATLTDTAPQLTLSAPNIGPVGTAVTLYGLNLGGVTSIRFAGSSNNVVSSGFTVNAAGTQISGVTVPAGAQAGPVDVTSSLGTSNGLVTFQVLPGANPAPAWQGASLAAVGGTSSVQRTQVDGQGNVVVAGTFTGTLTLGTTTLTSTGGTDVFVAKYSPATASYVWARSGGSTGNESVYGLAVQGSSVYVGGFFINPVATFGSVSLTTQNGSAGFVVKYTDAGSSATATWGVLVDDGSTAFVEALAVSGTSVYIGGDYTGTTLTIGNGTLSGQESSNDGYVAKLTDNGSTATFNWARRLGNAYGSVNVYGLGVRGSTVYLGATLFSNFPSGPVTIGPASLTISGITDILVARLTDLGTSADITAAINLGGTSTEFLGSLVVQGNALYLAGDSNSPTVGGATGAGSNDALVAKVVDNGGTLSVAWTQLLGGAGGDQGFQLAANGANVYVAGSFVGPATFGSTTLLGAGSSDAFVARLADAGSSASVSWVQAAGGLAADGGTALALAPGKVWVGGYVSRDAAFGPLAFTGPVGATAFLASLNDATVLGTAPAAAPAAARYVYPNPAHGTATVRLPAGGSPGLSLLDVRGQEVRRYPATAAPEATLDLGGLPAGLYLLRTGSGPALKLVVE